MERVFVAMRDGLLTVDPGDGSVEESLAGHRPECVTCAPAVALCGTADAGLFRSADGRQWTRVDDLADESVTAVAVGPDGTAWAGTEPSAVYRSVDDGRSWARCGGLDDLPSADEWSFPPRPETHHVRWIQPAPDDPEWLSVAIEAGALVRTADGGETWRDRTADGPRDSHTLATHPDAPDRVYAAAGDGYFESTDRGDTWRTRETGLERTYCWSVAVDPADPEHVLLSAAYGPRSAHDYGSADAAVYRRAGGSDGETRDGAGEWTRVPATAGLPDSDELLAPSLASVAPEVFLMAHNHGLQHSTDGGATWETLVEWSPDRREQRPAGVAVE